MKEIKKILQLLDNCLNNEKKQLDAYKIFLYLYDQYLDQKIRLDLIEFVAEEFSKTNSYEETDYDPHLQSFEEFKKNISSLKIKYIDIWIESGVLTKDSIRAEVEKLKSIIKDYENNFPKKKTLFQKLFNK